ncbi:MAG: MoaD/ThiS family protein [Candidatus Binataceae bacterium]
MATVFIPALLRKLTVGRDRAIARGHNLRQVIEDLNRQFPGLRESLVQDGELKPSIAVSIDGEIATEGLLEPVGEESEVHFLPALGGG